MAGILLRACFFLLMVILGYGMKKAGVLTKDDGVAVARVVLNITLPCAILVSFRTFVFEWGYMVIPLISFAANWAMLGIGYMISRRSGRDGRIFYMLELPAYNIGNFTLPFVSGILGATGVVATCLFDMGNSPMCLGLNQTCFPAFPTHPAVFSLKGATGAASLRKRTSPPFCAIACCS